MFGIKSYVKQKKNINNKKEDDQKMMRLTRFLITINIPGSAGPLRFLVNEEDLVSGVIDTALKSYARERRLPLLGSDTNDFLLYSPNTTFDALSPLEAIGSYGARNFILWKKPQKQQESQLIRDDSQKQSRRWNSKWKACFSPESKAVLAS